MNRRRNDDLPAFAAKLGKGQVDGLRRGGGAVVVRGVGDFHAGQRGHQGLIFEDGLQRALRNLGLVGRVGGVELTAAQHVVNHRRDVVVVRACAQKGNQIATHVLIAGGNVRQLGGSFHFGQRRRQIQLRESDSLAGTSLNRSSSVLTPMVSSIASRSLGLMGM